MRLTSALIAIRDRLFALKNLFNMSFSEDEANIIRMGNALVEVRGDNVTVYLAYRVKRVLESLETIPPMEFIRRMRKFLNAVCTENCSVYATTFLSRAPDSYMSELESLITNKLVEYEYDKANAKLRRELKLLKSIHNKLITGYLPLDVTTVILVACKLRSSHNMMQTIHAIDERVKLSAKFLGVELMQLKVSQQLVYLAKFRIEKSQEKTPRR